MKTLTVALTAAGLMVMAAGSDVVELSAPAAAATPKGLSNVEKAAEALQISNVMGRYAAYVIANRWTEIGEMFALDEPDVRQNVPVVMTGPAVRKYFADRQAQPLHDGEMHQHTFLSPIIEVAGDGKTAKGVWDSPGMDARSGDTMGKWTWVRYGVDFKKIGGEWKIWHMIVLTVWVAPYGEEWAKMVSTDSGGKMTGGGARPDGAPAAAIPAGAATPPGMPAAHPGWRYNGLGPTPLLPPVIPHPYYTFDPAEAY